MKRAKEICDYIIYLNIKINQLQNKIDKLKREVTIDNLTWLLNRKGIKKEFEKVISNKNRFSDITTLLLIDIDNFKRINDTYWHDIWDLVLIEISKIFKEKVRNNDVVCRFWGEEFVIIMHWTDLEWAFNKAQDIRKFIEDNLSKIINEIAHISSPKITVSIWVSKIRNEEENCIKALKRADDSLLDIKENWKNQVKYET